MKLFGKNINFGTDDPETATYKKALKQSTGDAFTRFIQSFKDGVSNWWKGFTGSGLTQRDILLNQMNMQNVEDTAQAQVEGYTKAGVNPALMFSGGASNSAPTTSATPTDGSMSEIMQAILLPMQMKMMEAQIGNVKANTAKTYSETEQLKQIMQYYPELTEKTIAEIASRSDLNFSNAKLADVKADVERIEKMLKESENKYADAYFKARKEYEEAKTEEARKSAAEKAAAALMTGFEYTYATKHNAKLSSSSILALASAIFKGFDNLTESMKDAIADILGSEPGEYDGHDLNHTGFKMFGDIGRRMANKKNGGSR